MIDFCYLFAASKDTATEHASPSNGAGNAATTSLSVLEGSVSNLRSVERNTGPKLFIQKWIAMFMKRMLHSMRYKRAIITQLLMPGFWTLIAMVVAKTFPQPTDSPALTMNTEMFKNNFVPYSDLERYILIPHMFFQSCFSNQTTHSIFEGES